MLESFYNLLLRDTIFHIFICVPNVWNNTWRSIKHITGSTDNIEAGSWNNLNSAHWWRHVTINNTPKQPLTSGFCLLSFHGWLIEQLREATGNRMTRSTAPQVGLESRAAASRSMPLYGTCALTTGLDFVFNVSLHSLPRPMTLQ